MSEFQGPASDPQLARSPMLLAPASHPAMNPPSSPLGGISHIPKPAGSKLPRLNTPIKSAKVDSFMVSASPLRMSEDAENLLDVDGDINLSALDGGVSLGDIVLVKNEAAIATAPTKPSGSFKPTSSKSQSQNDEPVTSASSLPAVGGLSRKRKEPDNGGAEDMRQPSSSTGSALTGLRKRPMTALGVSVSNNGSTTLPRAAVGARSASVSSASQSGPGFRPSSGASSTSSVGTTRSALNSSTARVTSSSSSSLTARNRLAKSTSATSSASSSVARPRAAVSATTGIATRSRSDMAKPSVSSMTSRPTATTRSALSSSTTTRTTTTRSANGARPSGAPTAIGSGMASAAQVTSQGGRLAQVEKAMSTMQDLVKHEQEKLQSLQASQSALQNLLASSQNTEKEIRRNLSTAGEEMAILRAKHQDEVDDLERKLSRKERERKEIEEDLQNIKTDLDITRGEVRELKIVINTQATSHLVVTTENDALKAQNARLQREIDEQLATLADMRSQVQAANDRVTEVEEELRTAETIRRKLHNQIQELKGNIRVFARVRPALEHEKQSPEGIAEMDFGPDRGIEQSQQLVIQKSRDSAQGNCIREPLPFAFDKVFKPSSNQGEVFEEISMLTQSVLDGYNVCIFAYGQTGSGKSWTMEGGRTEETRGMIPRAMEMVFREADYLKERGWQYRMGGQYVEIYNEQINDLLGDASFDSIKHEIKHENGRTRVTGIEDKPMTSSDQVADLLAKAGRRRAVAATLMNERSSRSHSVFSLRVSGKNELTGESCEGILNLVDLAGSERLDKSGTADDKDRRKETININKSLSALQNVIQKLSEKSSDTKVHVNYRDSQLTYLLQNSLSGQSKTLMFCNISPMASHLNETLNSLRFATKVNATTIGTAKKQTKA